MESYCGERVTSRAERTQILPALKGKEINKWRWKKRGRPLLLLQKPIGDDAAASERGRQSFSMMTPMASAV